MKACFASYIICPRCTSRWMINERVGDKYIASCDCGFRCLQPMLDVTPCDENGDPSMPGTVELSTLPFGRHFLDDLGREWIKVGVDGNCFVVQSPLKFETGYMPQTMKVTPLDVETIDGERRQIAEPAPEPAKVSIGSLPVGADFRDKSGLGWTKLVEHEAGTICGCRRWKKAEMDWLYAGLVVTPVKIPAPREDWSYLTYNRAEGR